MQTLRARVENGKLVADAPAGLPEGSEVDLCVVDAGDEMDDEELAN